MGGFFDEIFDPAAGPDVVKHLHNGQWRSTGRDAYTSVANPSKGGTAFRVQGALGSNACAERCAARACLPSVPVPLEQGSATACKLSTRCPHSRAPPAGCTVEDVDAAYEGAHAAQALWARTPLHARCALLHKVAALMRSNAQPIAACLVAEVAKPAKDALAEVVRYP